jgi:hypothetical protein
MVISDDNSATITGMNPKQPTRENWLTKLGIYGLWQRFIATILKAIHNNA